MYATFLLLHSWARWLILVFGVLAVFAAFRALAKGGWVDAKLNRHGLFYTISLDVQFLLGIVLYVWLTPWVTVLSKNPGAAMGDRLTRYWAVEHLFGMIVAIVLAHIGRAGMKKGRYKKAAILFIISLLIILASIPWPFMPYARPMFRF